MNDSRLQMERTTGIMKKSRSSKKKNKIGESLNLHSLGAVRGGLRVQNGQNVVDGDGHRRSSGDKVQKGDKLVRPGSGAFGGEFAYKPGIFGGHFSNKPEERKFEK